MHDGAAELTLLRAAAHDFIEVTPDLLPAVQRLLRSVRHPDPFSRSAGYYAVTGRKGLWLYGHAGTAMMIARHPNRTERLLFFAPFGRNPDDLIRRALSDPRLPAGKPQMARLAMSDAPLAAALARSSFDEEDVLDWAYPVHVLSTESVSAFRGQNFKSVRNRVHQAERHGLTAQPIDIALHEDAIRSIALIWARRGDKPGYSFEDLTQPTEACLALMRAHQVSLDGIIVFDKDEPVGFWIWDAPDGPAGPALSIARVSLTKGKGESEFAAVAMCRLLRERGFTSVCSGGSETASLDTFKIKFCPARSISLGSIHNLKRGRSGAWRAQAFTLPVQSEHGRENAWNGIGRDIERYA